MNTYQTYKELKRHLRLSERRNANFERNTTAKFIFYLSMSLLVLYLMGIAVMMSLAVNSDKQISSLELICALMPFILFIDFGFRFFLQQTPSQLVKPYLLLPIGKYSCIDNFIIASLLSYGNLVWFALLIPYTIMSVVFGYGVLTTIYLLVFFWLMILADSQWYAIVRTLINKNMLYWTIPVAVYLALLTPVFSAGGMKMEHLLEFYSNIGNAIQYSNPLPLTGALILAAALTIANRQVQYVHIQDELMPKTSDKTKHKTANLSFLERFGEIGMYLQLEVKMIIRNKSPRTSFLASSVATLFLSLIIIFTDIYDSIEMANFWCIYCFLIYGTSMIMRIMCYEGNFIDCLMVRKENILSMLKAYYILYSLLLLFPFMLMLPIVIAGKWSIWMLLSFAVFTAGFQYFLMFQMAVYNKTSMPLNTKFVGKGNNGNNYVQIIAAILGITVPIILLSVLPSIVGNKTSYIILTAIGFVFIATHNVWLRNIYNRMMARRYDNMNALRETR